MSNKAAVGIIIGGILLAGTAVGIYYGSKPAAAADGGGGGGGGNVTAFKVGDLIRLTTLPGSETWQVMGVYPDMVLTGVTGKGAYLIQVIANGLIGSQVYLDFTSARTRFTKIG